MMKISIALYFTLASSLVAAETEEFGSDGARLYIERCALCHGNFGNGDGIIPLAIESYPSTDLLNPEFGTDLNSIMKTTKWGGSKGEMNPLSPPWINELTSKQVKSVSEFVINLRSHAGQAKKSLQKASAHITSTKALGKSLYASRCKLCHGNEGKGDGVLAKKIIADPPPFNLTESERPAPYLRNIIKNGGASLGRSEQMPPWRNELLDHEVESVVLFIESIKI